MGDETKAPTKAEQKIIELEKQLKEQKAKAEEAELKLKSLDRAPVVQESNETQAVLENLQAKISELEKAQKVQFITVDGKKPMYRPVAPEDIMGGDDKAVTFIARCVMKVIPGYMNEYGVEVVAPHKMIVFNYAASDIRQDGKEEDILNFCQFTTRLKSEVEFLQGHPEYGLTFGENMNEVAGHDVKEYQFKVKAAEQVNSMSPESVQEYCKMLKITNYMRKSTKELKNYIVASLVVEYKQQDKILQKNLQDRLFEQARKVANMQN